MALNSGKRLGPYEIIAPIGAGGMGEVYRARDTRLDRMVAIKVLPEHLSSDPVRRSRFEHEARTISGLSHPNICALFDIGEQDDIHYLVLECLQGESLADRLVRGPLPTSEVLQIGAEIASALELAHRSGIVHRDLKPANVMLTKSGAKLLDFGLAKPSAALASAAAADTRTLTKSLTEEGVIVGTLRYMAPEQLEGKNTDGRTDIFSLGALLYEMSTGRTAFSGASRATIIGAIMSSEPAPMSSLQPLTPPVLEQIVKGCLAKDPDARWQSAQDVKLQLQWILQAGSQAGVSAPISRGRKKLDRFAWIFAGLFAIGFAIFGIRDYERARQSPAVTRFVISPPEQHSFDGMNRVRVSPDGKKLAMEAMDAEGKSSLWVRYLDDPVARELPGTNGTKLPVWSADSRFLLFIAEGKVKKIDIQGGAPDVLCDTKLTSPQSWNSADIVLLMGGLNQQNPIWRMNLDDCSVTPATKLDSARYDLGHYWPRFLPDGRHFVYAGLRANNKHDILLGSLGADTNEVLVRNGSNPQYAAGYLFFERNGYLFAYPFDLRKLRVTSEPAQVISEQLLFIEVGGVASYDVSNTGVLVYQTQGGVRSRVIIADEHGTELETITESKMWDHVEISPDEKMLLASQGDAQAHTSDLWIYDLQHKKGKRFSYEGSVGFHAGVWSPDGETIVYAANKKHQGLYQQLYRKAVGSTGEAEPLLVNDADKVPTDWSRDGRSLLYTEWSANGQAGLWVLPMAPNERPVQLTKTPFSEQEGRFSPDGRWIAYSSNQSGDTQVYVRPFLKPGNPIAISSAGGSAPQWSRDGNTLYYFTPDWKLMATSLTLRANSIQPARSRALFSVPPDSQFSLLPDGKFLINEQIGHWEGPVIVALNWMARLPRSK